MMSQNKIDTILDRAKATFLHQVTEKPNFINSKAIMLISVGKETHEGAKLSAAIELINRSFKACDIIVCDVLQRHTLQMNNLYSSENIYAASVLAGKEWAARNNKYFQSFKIPCNIFHWEKYLLRQEFPLLRERIIAAYEEDCSFKEAMHDTISEFTSRDARRSDSIDKDMAFKCCFDYLVEETAIIMLMMRQYQYNYIVYPGKMPKVLSVARDKFVVENGLELLKWVTIYIRHR